MAHEKSRFYSLRIWLRLWGLLLILLTSESISSPLHSHLLVFLTLTAISVLSNPALLLTRRALVFVLCLACIPWKMGEA